MTDGGQDFNLGHVVGADGAKGDDGSTIWNTSTAPTYASSKYTFTISNLSGKTGLQIAVNDIIFYSTYYYIVSTVNTTTVDCSTRVSIKGSDASVTIVDNLTSDSSTSVLSAKQGKVLNTNKIETSAIATSFGSTTSDSKVPSEKLVSDSLATKQATLISGTSIKTINNTSLLGSGNIDIQGSSVDIVTSWESTLSDSKVASEKLTKNTIDAKLDKTQTSYKGKNVVVDSTTGDITFENKPTIPTKVSDLTNDSGFITSSSLPAKTSDLVNDGSSSSDSLVYVETSATSGLLKSDGTVDTSTYLTEMKIGSTANLPVITGTSGALTAGSFGTSSGTFAEGNHSHNQITSDGKITSTAVTVASGDNIVITDASDSSKIKRVANLLTDHVKDGTAHSNIGSSANATQSTINSSIDTALSNKISKSQTSGLVKNDGSIDTSTYLTSSAITGMLTTSDIANNLTTTTTGKVLDASQGKALADLIGQAITYINQ